MEEGISLWAIEEGMLGVGCVFIFPAILISYFIYHIIRPFWKVTVNCWFCNENIRVPYCNRKAFICLKCGQYNGFKDDGDYDRFIPEQRYEHLNPIPNKKINGMRESSASNGLCQRCNMQQSRIQAQINKFEPRNEANFDDEFEVYKARLHKSYPLCNDCEQFVQRKLKLDQKVVGSNRAKVSHTPSVRSFFCRSSQLPQKHFSEISEISRHNCTHRRRRAALFNCGPISNCLNLVTFFASCCLFTVYFLQLQNETNTALLDLSRFLPGYMLSSWIPLVMFHTSKVIFLGFCSHITSVAMMRARRSLPDIVAFFIWCALAILDYSEGGKHELFLSQLSFASILCIVSFAVAFLPRKLLHRKRPNNIIQSAFSIASTPLSQCSTISSHTSPEGGLSCSESMLDRSASSRESTPSRELGKMFNSLSLGNDPITPKGMPRLQQRRGPFDSMKKPILAEPRLRFRDTRKGLFLDNGMHPSSRYVRSFAPSTMTSISAVRDPRKFTLFNVICVLGMLLSVALNAAMFYKLFYSSRP